MTHSFTITIGDSERIALKDAIKVYKEFIHDKIGDEIKAPYWARLQSIKRVEEEILNSIPEILSMNTFNIRSQKEELNTEG